MADYPGGFVGPGYAVAGTLQDILARKQQQQRQSMLDSLNEKQTLAGLEESKMRADAYKEQQEAMAEYRRSQARNEWLKQFRMGDTASPEDIQKYGAESLFPEVPEQSAQVTTSYTIPATSQWEGDDMEGGMVETPEQTITDDASPLQQEVAKRTARKFIGTAPEREEAEGRNLMSYYQAHPEVWDKMDNWQRAIAYRQVDPKGTMPAWLGKPEDDQMVDFYTAGPKGVTPQGQVKKGSIIHNLPQPRAGRAPARDQMAFVPDPNNPGNFKTVWVNPDTHTITDAANPGLIKTAPKPEDTTKPIIPTDVWSRYTASFKGSTPEQRRLYLAQAIEAANTTPEIKAIVNQIRTTPEVKDMTSEQIVANVSGDDGTPLTDQEKGDLLRLLKHIRNK